VSPYWVFGMDLSGIRLARIWFFEWYGGLDIGLECLGMDMEITGFFSVLDGLGVSW